MKRLWLEIAGAVILVIVTTIVVRVFWPGEIAPSAEPTHAKQTQKDKGISKTQPKAQQSRVERLYQMALLQKSSDESLDVRYKKLVDYCQQIFREFPHSPQAKRTRELLAEVPKTYLKQYNISRRDFSRPKVEKSRQLRRRYNISRIDPAHLIRRKAPSSSGRHSADEKNWTAIKPSTESASGTLLKGYSGEHLAGVRDLSSIRKVRESSNEKPSETVVEHPNSPKIKVMHVPTK